MKECEEFVKKLHLKFGVGTFEFFHTRKLGVEGYSLGVHRKLHREGYIEVMNYSGKARLYGLTKKAMKIIEVKA